MDNLGILGLFQVLMADNFGILALFQVLIAENVGIFITFLGISCGQVLRGNVI